MSSPPRDDRRTGSGTDFYRDLVESLDAILFVAAPDFSRFQFVSPQAHALLGYAVDRWSAERFWFDQIVHPEDRDAIARKVAEQVALKQDHQTLYRAVCEDGTVKWLRHVARVHLDGTGEVVDIRGFMMNITAERHPEQATLIDVSRPRNVAERADGNTEATRLGEARLRLALEGSAISLYENDAELRYTWIANPKFGMTAEQILGRTDEQLLPPAQVERLVALKRRVLERGIAEEMPLDTNVDGRRYTFSVRAEPVSDEAGHVTGLRVASVDVTPLREAQRALERSSKAKDEFLAILGHELRNPLAPIRTGLDLLRHAPHDGDVSERILPMMNRQVDHLVRLVDDLLDISRISRGQIALELETLDLAVPVQAAIEQTTPLIGERHHELVLNAGNASLPVHGDAERLTQVVANLLSNAAKYTDPGGMITITTGEDETGHAVLSVRDTGFGIPPERRDKLFELFSQIPEHQARTGGGGLGIGLALSHQLIAMHDGSMEALSEGAGHGSEFVVRLPLSGRIGTPRTPSAQQGSIAPRRVLIVDDNVDAAETLRMLLEAYGHSVDVAVDGASALAAWQRFEPHVTLLDLGLPGMDGFDVARGIRGLAGDRPARLIAVTGRGQEADRTRSKAAGFDHHLTKPVDDESLRRLFADLGRG